MSPDWTALLTPPWEPVTAEFARTVEHELRREMHPAHVLYDRCTHAVALATRQDCDDVAFEIAGGYAIVHLTWKGRAEHGVWPGTQTYDTLAALQASMARDSAEWDD